MHGEELAAGLQPAQDGCDVVVPSHGIYGAKKGVLKNEIKGVEGFVFQEVAQMEIGFVEFLRGALLGSCHGARSEVVA